MNYIVTKSPKSYGIAILLILIFGPIGLFYSTILGGLIMTVVVPIGVFFGIISGVIPTHNTGVLIFGGIGLYYIFLFMWSLTAISNYNERIHANAFVFNESVENIQSDYSYEYQDERKNRSPFYYFIVTAMIMLLALGLYLIFK